MAQGGGSLCMGVALVLGALDTSLQCLRRVRRRDGAGVGNARLRAVMLWTEEVVCNEYTVGGRRDEKQMYTESLYSGWQAGSKTSVYTQLAAKNRALRYSRRNRNTAMSGRVWNGGVATRGLVARRWVTTRERMTAACTNK